MLTCLERRSRAYNALYALGESTPATVRTLTDNEVESILQVAHEANFADRSLETMLLTQLDLAHAMLDRALVTYSLAIHTEQELWSEASRQLDAALDAIIAASY